jgi:hypothetical protein
MSFKARAHMSFADTKPLEEDHPEGPSHLRHPKEQMIGVDGLSSGGA